MNLKPIYNEDDYHKALERLEHIFDAKPNTPEGDELKALGQCISNYENEVYPIGLPDHSNL